MLPQTDSTLCGALTKTRLSLSRRDTTRCTAEAPAQLRIEQHERGNNHYQPPPRHFIFPHHIYAQREENAQKKLKFHSSIDPNYSTHASICVEPSLMQKTPYASSFVFFLPPLLPQPLQSFSQHASWTESSSTLELRVGCRTSWMLLRATVKSWAIPDGNGGTLEATRLGQEAAFCGEAEEAGSDIQGLKKTMAAPPTTTTTSSPRTHPLRPKIPVLLSCLSGGGRRK